MVIPPGRFECLRTTVCPRRPGRNPTNPRPFALRRTGWLPDLHAVELAWTQRLAARLAFHGEDGGEAGAARRAVGPELAAALRTRGRQLVLRLVEVALREATGETEGSPVAQDLPAFFAKPVCGFDHDSNVACARCGRDGWSSWRQCCSPPAPTRSWPATYMPTAPGS